MKFGVAYYSSGYGIQVADLAKALEDIGFDALFLPEHSHIPVNMKTQWPVASKFPPEYPHFLDPFVGLAAAAAVTRTLKLGTGVTLITERDPIRLAKEVSTLDHISGGRVILGVGAGWNKDELENHGMNPADRFKVMRERILAMKEIWTKDEAEFHGKFVNFDPLFSYPKPVQKPHPPIYVGGHALPSLKRVVEYGDGWLPHPQDRYFYGGQPWEEDKLRELRQLEAAAGRAPVPVTIFAMPPDPKLVEEYERLGIERCLFRLSDYSSPEDALPWLARFESVAKSFA